MKLKHLRAGLWHLQFDTHHLHTLAPIKKKIKGRTELVKEAREMRKELGALQGSLNEEKVEIVMRFQEQAQEVQVVLTTYRCCLAIAVHPLLQLQG